MFEDLIVQLEKLEKTEIEIFAEGNYPKGTEVQDVAIWQNDGTPSIKPAKFIEAAEKVNRMWDKKIHAAISDYLDGDEIKLKALGIEIAHGIAVAVNRIDTYRLKQSIRSRIKQ